MAAWIELEWLYHFGDLFWHRVPVADGSGVNSKINILNNPVADPGFS